MAPRQAKRKNFNTTTSNSQPPSWLYKNSNESTKKPGNANNETKLNRSTWRSSKLLRNNGSSCKKPLRITHICSEHILGCSKMLRSCSKLFQSCPQVLFSVKLSLWISVLGLIFIGTPGVSSQVPGTGTSLPTPNVRDSLRLVNILVRRPIGPPAVRKECRLLPQSEFEKITNIINEAKRDTVRA